MSNDAVIQSLVKIPKTSKPQPHKPLSNSRERDRLALLAGHSFIYANQIVKCCSKQASLESWEYLKKAQNQLKLDSVPESCPSCIFKTKANCLQSCCSRRIMMVHPAGVWYWLATPGSNQADPTRTLALVVMTL